MKFDELKRRVAACDYSANPQVTLHDDSATWDFNLIQFSVLVVLTCEQEDAPRTAVAYFQKDATVARVALTSDQFADLLGALFDRVHKRALL